MAQAKTLTKEEMARVMDYIRTRRFAPRNRAMMLLTHLAGLRIRKLTQMVNKLKIETSISLRMRDEEVEIHGKSNC